MGLNFPYLQTPVLEVESVTASEFEGANGGSTSHDAVLYSLLLQLSDGHTRERERAPSGSVTSR